MKLRRNLFLGTLVTIALSQAAIANTYNWNGFTTGSATGISDTWDTATANWTDYATTWPATSTNDDDAVFGGTGGAVTIATGGVTANELSFAADAYVLSGAGITLDGTTPTITADSTLTTISSIISGSAGLTKAGFGNLTLSGANNYTGVTNINAGTLIAGNAAALGSNVDGTTVTSGAVLDVGGQNLGTEVVTISGDGLGDGAIVNSGAVQIYSLGRIVLADNATIGGEVRWDLRNSTPTLNMAGFTLTKTGANYLGLVGATISNPGNVIVNQGELNLTFGSTFGGIGAANTVTVNTGGILSFYQTSNIHGSTLNLNDGSTLRGENGSGTQNTWSGPISVTGEVTLDADGILNLPANITGTANLTKTGTSTAILSGTNSITSTALTISGGSLQINTPASLPNAPSISVASGASGALVLGNGITVGSGKTITIAGGGANGGFYGALNVAAINTGTSEWQGNVIIGEATGTRVGSLGGILHISGDISETNPGSALTIRNDENVNGSVTLSGNNTYTGTTTLSAAGLRIGSATALGSGPFLVDNGTRIASITSTDTTPRTITNATTLNSTTGTLTLGDATRNGKLTFSNTIDLGTAVRPVATNSEVEFAGIVSGALGGITKSGTGNLILSADNSYTGATNINAGTIVAAHVNALATTSAVNISTSTGGGTLRLATDDSVAAYKVTSSSNNPATILSDRATPGEGITHALGAAVLGANIHNFAAGPNVTSGTAGISLASLDLAAGNSNACTLNPTSANVTLSGSVTIGTNKAAKTLALGGTSTGNLISGVISNGLDTLNVSKIGTGTWTLSNINTYTGTTSVVSGILKLDYSTDSSRILDTAALNLAGGTLELSGGNHPEVVSGTTLIGNRTSTVTRSSGYSVLQMNAITRQGGSFLNFTEGSIATTDTLNTNGILGPWARVGGIDWAVNSTNAADGPITALATYTLTSAALNSAASYAAANITVNSNQGPDGPIAPNSLRFNDLGAFTLTLQGANSIASGGILVTSAVGENTSTITGGTLTGPNNGDLLVLQDNPSGNLVIASQIINTGTTNVVKHGVGAATLSGDNTYTGATTVAGGTLTLSGNKTGTSGAITVSTQAGVNATLNIENGTYAVGGNNFIVGNAQGVPATGTVNQSGGVVSFSSGNGLLLGNAGETASTGIYNLSGGSINTGTASTNRGVMLGANGNSINIFNLSGTGALNMTAATGGTATSILQIGRSDAAANNTTNIFNQTGGTANVAIFSVGGNGTTSTGITSTVSWTGGIFVAGSFPRLAAGNTNTATLTIGGTADVTLPAFPTARGTSSTATLTFDGGVLKPLATSTAYLGGLTNAFIQDGGARFSVDTGKDITVSQALLTDPVSTGGGLTKEGVGKLTLSSASTYTGATLISAGTLQIGAGGTTGSILLGSAITNNGTLAFNRSDTLTQGTDFANGISGTGGVTKLGTGTLILSAANSYQGNTLFGTAAGTSTGILRLANSSAMGSGKLIINNGNADTGTVELTGGINVANNIDFFGRSASTTAAIIRNVSGDNTLSGVLTGSLNGGNYNFHSDVGTLTISNKITTSTSGRVLNLRGLGAINITGVIEDGAGSIGVRTQEAGTYTLAGLNTYTRYTEITTGTALTLASTGQLRFVPTTNGVTTNVVSGAGTFNANGTFLLDLSGADATAGNSWLLVDVTTLTETFGDNFDVTSTAGDLTETSAGVWEITDSGKTWTFTESTGILSVADAATDDYATWSGPSGFNLSGGLGADDDGDGLTNFEEYAFGLNPTTGSSVNPITQQLNKASGTFKYTRRATPATTGVTYTYESSTTLSGLWDSITPVSAVSNNATPIEEITVTVPGAPLTDPKFFIRVKATKP